MLKKSNFEFHSKKSNSRVFLIPIFKDNYIFLIVNNKNEALIVDPGSSDEVKIFLNEYESDRSTSKHNFIHNQIQTKSENPIKPVAILITHFHQDHVGGVGELSAMFTDLTIISSRDSREEQSKKLNHLREKYQFDINVTRTPGHTKDHIVFYENNEKWLFCGDVLFRFGCGRVFDGKRFIKPIGN